MPSDAEDLGVERLAPEPLHRLAALLDYPETPWPEGEAPPVGHWLYFLPTAQRSTLGADGHPLPDPDARGLRRMWAGSRITVLAPLPLETPVERRARVAEVRETQGRSGPLRLVTLELDYRVKGRLLRQERQDLVYRPAAAPAATEGQPAPGGRACHSFQADAVTLFRYSALTFNAHRIHYDRRYAREVEGHADLVTHGPLLATVLWDAFRQTFPGVELSQLRFRALRPTYVDEAVEIRLTAEEGPITLFAVGPDGTARMRADFTPIG